MQKKLINETLIGAVLFDKTAGINRIVRNVDENGVVTAVALTSTDEPDESNVITFGPEAAILFRYIKGTADRKTPEGYTLEKGVLRNADGVSVPQGNLVFKTILAAIPGRIVLVSNEDELYTYDPERDKFQKHVDWNEAEDKKTELSLLRQDENVCYIANNIIKKVPELDEAGKQIGTKEITACVKIHRFVYEKQPRRNPQLYTSTLDVDDDELLTGVTVVDGMPVLTISARNEYGHLSPKRYTLGINGKSVDSEPVRITTTTEGTTIEFKDSLLVNDRPMPLIPGFYLIESYEENGDVTVLVFTNGQYAVKEMEVKSTSDRGDIITVR